MRSGALVCAALLAVVLAATQARALTYDDVRGAPYNVSYDHRAITINGERVLLLSGSIHYPRSSVGMWPGILARSKAAGLNAIQIYSFWNLHEPTKGAPYFLDGNANVTRFLEDARDAGLFIVLRIGPYVCAEWDYGGLPYWLRDDASMVFRDTNSGWQAAMTDFMQRTVALVEPFLARNGGPIILLQTENEYGNVEGWYGKPGQQYVQWNGQLAASLATDTPWIMCQQRDAPLPVINTCNGFYCDDWLAAHFANFTTQPGMWTENWPGWFQHWGEPVPHRPVQDVVFALARWVAKGGTHQNYYMWHGGTTFGRWTGGPFIVTSYDYDVALNEYGLPSEPKYGHSARLHDILNRYRRALLQHDVPTAQPLGAAQEAHVYGSVGAEDCLVFLSNWDAVNTVTVHFQNKVFVLPAWSVSLLDGRDLHVLYNTATIRHLDAVVAERAAAQLTDEQRAQWQSAFHQQTAAPEVVESPVPTKVTFRRSGPRDDAVRVALDNVQYAVEQAGGWSGLPAVFTPSPQEQLTVTRDTTDYLWYSTNVTVPSPVPNSIALQLNAIQDFVYVYVDGAYVWSGLGADGSLNVNVPAGNLTAGATATVQVLVLTQGLMNYGPFLEQVVRGLRGPVTWNGAAVTNGGWVHVAGLQGEYEDWPSNPTGGSTHWQPWSGAGSLQPAGAQLVWFYATINTPHAERESESVWAFDLAAMGKGALYVNGYALGRYWSVLATEGTCGPCDYRGPYDSDNCRTGCGEPSQRYYHIPRDWLAPEGQPNSVVLLEETAQSADPSKVSLVQMNQ